MDKKLTDSEIPNVKELLEYKVKAHCELCDLKNLDFCGTCIYNAIKQFIELFNRLQAENAELVGNVDRLKAELFEKTEQLNVELQAMRNAANGFKAERNKLADELYEAHKEEYIKCMPCIEKNKAEAYKEVFQKLKDKSIVCKVKLYGKGEFFPCLSAVTLHDIKLLEKELVGEG